MSRHVYFVRDRTSGNVKIGHAWNVDSRLSLIRRRQGLSLELLATIPGDRRLEDRFHMLLLDHHLGHEWFAPHARVEAVVVAVSEGWLDFSKLPDGTSPIRSASAHRAWAIRRRAA
jgi:hypothetical protein